jgi:hypothetical protein
MMAAIQAQPSQMPGRTWCEENSASGYYGTAGKNLTETFLAVGA